MGLSKGQTNNPTGRPKGSQNKVTASLKGRISSFLESNWDTIETDFKSLDPQSRIALFEKLLKYVVPQQRETKLDLASLSDEEIDSLLEKAMDKIDNE